jgi:glycosyltransferase involved in cell wall biosynthesis
VKRDVVISAAIQGANSFLVLCIAGYVGKYAGLATLGEIGLLLALIPVGSTLIGFGLPEQVQFDLANKKTGIEKSSGLYNVCVRRQFAFAAIGAISGLVVYFTTSSNLGLICASSCISGFSALLTEVFARIDFQLGRFARGQIVSSSASLLFWVVVAIGTTLHLHEKPALLALFSWGGVAAVAGLMQRMNGVRLTFGVSSSGEENIGNAALSSRLLIAVGGALPYLLLNGLADKSIAGALSLVSRLFGPFGVVFSSLTMAVQRAVFVGGKNSFTVARRACRLQLCATLAIALLLWSGMFLVPSATRLLFDSQKISFWFPVLLILLLHRAFSLAFQFSAQALLPFAQALKGTLVGVLALALYIPAFLIGVEHGATTINLYSLGLLALALVIQPCVSLLGVWFFARDRGEQAKGEQRRKVTICVTSLGLGGAEDIIVRLANGLAKTSDVHLLVLLRCDEDRTRVGMLSGEVHFKAFLPGLRRQNSLEFKILNTLLYVAGPLLAPLFFVRYALYSRHVLHINLTQLALYSMCWRLLCLGKRRPRFIQTFHTNSHLLKPWQRIIFRMSWRLMDKVVVEIDEKEIVEVRRYIAEQKIDFVPFAVPYDPDRLIRKEKLETEIVIGSLARLRLFEKKYDLILRSLALLKERGVRFRYLIGGDGPDRAQIEKIVCSLGLQNHVEFHGRIEDRASFFARLDLVIVATVGYDTGIAGLQALAAGVPLVGLDTTMQALEETGRVFLVANSPEQLADHVEYLLRLDLTAYGAGLREEKAAQLGDQNMLASYGRLFSVAS